MGEWRALGFKVVVTRNSEDEANIKGGKISVGSPIARALIGKLEGDIAEVQSPGGVKELEVLEVSYI